MKDEHECYKCEHLKIGPLPGNAPNKDLFRKITCPVFGEKIIGNNEIPIAWPCTRYKEKQPELF